MLFDDLTCSESEFQRVRTTTEKTRVPARVLTLGTNKINGTLWAWVLEKAWTIDMKVLRKKPIAQLYLYHKEICVITRFVINIGGNILHRLFTLI